MIEGQKLLEEHVVFTFFSRKRSAVQLKIFVTQHGYLMDNLLDLEITARRARRERRRAVRAARGSRLSLNS